ncbi:lysozyme-like [Dermacentor variabilis]|uniref:lysozyme-like n=1 Tax=Dermacentor variabilis TaxID=34621 RepID=UPI003F5C364B
MQLVEVAALLTLVTATVGKKFTRCSLSKELARNGIPRGQMANWVCLVNSESGMNTRAMNRNRDGSVDYGLFQINNRYWCSPGPHNQCRVRCKDLLSDNIKAAVKCAKFIYKRMGFSAWYGWQAKCRGRNLGRYNRGCRF